MPAITENPDRGHTITAISKVVISRKGSDIIVLTPIENIREKRRRTACPSGAFIRTPKVSFSMTIFSFEICRQKLALSSADNIRGAFLSHTAYGNDGRKSRYSEAKNEEQ